jgi:hypothetical protein
MNDADFRLSNFSLRTHQYYPKHQVRIGLGDNSLANVLTVQLQPAAQIKDKDAVSGALKHVGLLDDAFRTSTEIVKGESNEVNYALFEELVGLMKPRLIVACGEEAMGFVRNKKVLRWNRHIGKKFKADNLPQQITCVAVTNPFDYGFATASPRLKDQGRREWNFVQETYSNIIKAEFGYITLEEIYGKKGSMYGWV